MRLKIFAAFLLCSSSVLGASTKPTTRPTQQELLAADNRRMQREIADLREQLRKAKGDLIAEQKIVKQVVEEVKKYVPQSAPDGVHLGDSEATCAAFLKSQHYVLIHSTQSEHIEVQTWQWGSNPPAFITATFEDGKLTVWDS